MADEEVKPEIEVEVAAETPAEPVVEEKPVAETKDPATEAAPTADATSAEVEDWRDRELRRKHAQIKEKDRKLAERDQEIADLRTLAESSTTEGTAPSVVPTKPLAQMSQPEIQKAAQQLRDQERYQEQLASTNTNGEKAYGAEWNKSLDRLTQFGTIDPQDMTAILNTDNSAKVLYELGKNPAEYQRILDLPPARRLNEYVKIAMKENPKAPQPSKAPAPVDAVKPRSTPQMGLRDDMDDDAWFAQRRKEKREKFNATQGR